jgi:hypothetical protein
MGWDHGNHGNHGDGFKFKDGGALRGFAWLAYGLSSSTPATAPKPLKPLKPQFPSFRPPWPLSRPLPFKASRLGRPLLRRIASIIPFPVIDSSTSTSTSTVHCTTNCVTALHCAPHAAFAKRARLNHPCLNALDANRPPPASSNWALGTGHSVLLTDSTALLSCLPTSPAASQRETTDNRTNVQRAKAGMRILSYLPLSAGFRPH